MRRVSAGTQSKLMLKSRIHLTLVLHLSTTIATDVRIVSSPCRCLYEIYMAWKLKAEVSCGFVPAGEQMVIQSLQEGDALIEHMLSRVDAEKSQATVESDRLMILELIKKDGVSKFNQFVRQKFAASLRVVALTTVPSTASADMLDWAPDLPERTLSCDTRSHFARQISLESTVDESVRHIREIFRV